MTPQQLIKKIEAVANKQHRHPHYGRTCELAELYKQIATTMEQGVLVVSYKPSETAMQKEQRLEIYTSKTPAVVSQIMSQFDFVSGAPRVTDNIEYSTENAAAQRQEAVLNAAVSRFYGRQTLQQYLEEKQKLYSLVDPNAWLIISNANGTITPSIVGASSALDFECFGGITKYLVVGSSRQINGNIETDYYGYSAGVVVYCTLGSVEGAESAATVTLKGKTYKVYISENNTQETPAIRFGYEPDIQTMGETFVGILEPAVEEFKDLINQKSEYDLTLALHTFLKKYQIVDPCDYRDSDQPHIRCNNGTLTPGGITCPKCGGTGVKSHTTSQDVISVTKPRDKEDMIVKLSDMVYYVTMPFDIVNHQAERVDKLAKEIPKYIFGVDIENKPTAATATEIENFYNCVYMVIAPFADKISQNYIFTVFAAAQMLGIADNLVVNHKYPKSFKMETLSDLMVLLNAAKQAGASTEILWGIEQRIAEIQNKDNPEKLEWLKIKNKFRPFKNLSESERIVEVSLLPADNPYRILHGYLDEVFRRIMEQYPNFTELNKTAQERIVLDAAAAFAAENAPIIPSLETTIE